MSWSLKLFEGPAVEPVTLEETKAVIRVSHPDEDQHIQRLITVARQQAERRTGFALITQTWDLYLDYLPDRDWLPLPKPPLQEVLSVTYLDPQGEVGTVDPASYRVDIASKPGRILLYGDSYWPTISTDPASTIVRFKAGYGPSAIDVPAEVRQAVLLLVADLYEHRETLYPGTLLGELPTVRRLLTDRTFHF